MEPSLCGPQPSNAGKMASPLDPSGSSGSGWRVGCCAAERAPLTAHRAARSGEGRPDATAPACVT